MATSRFHRTFGYALATVTAIAAVIIVTGFLLPESVPTQLRIMFGIVLFLLAVYRAVITFVQSRQRPVDPGGDHE